MLFQRLRSRRLSGERHRAAERQCRLRRAARRWCSSRRARCQRRPSG